MWKHFTDNMQFCIYASLFRIASILTRHWRVAEETRMLMLFYVFLSNTIIQYVDLLEYVN